MATFSQKRPVNLSIFRRQLSDIDRQFKIVETGQRDVTSKQLEPSSSTSFCTVLGKRNLQQRNELDKSFGQANVSAELSTETAKFSKSNSH
jgi:hypothetical protein